MNPSEYCLRAPGFFPGNINAYGQVDDNFGIGCCCCNDFSYFFLASLCFKYFTYEGGGGDPGAGGRGPGAGGRGRALRCRCCCGRCGGGVDPVLFHVMIVLCNDT